MSPTLDINKYQEENVVNKRVKLIVVRAMAIILLFGGIAAAASKTETIDITFRSIRIVVDGEEFVPKDVNNNLVEPFIYNGTTYLPVRAVSQALGREVSWDGDTSTVNINSKGAGESGGGQDITTQIIETVLNRDIVDEALISTFSDNPEITSMLKKYNEQTSVLFAHFYVSATQTFTYLTVTGFSFSEGEGFFGEWNRPPRYPFTPRMVAEASWRIAKHALYPDARERIYNDPFFIPVLEKEGGGSHGMWPDQVHNFYNRPEAGALFEGYPNLVDTLIAALKENAT